MEAGEAMPEWTDVLVLGKVTDQLIILALSLGGPHGSSSISLVLPNDYPCCVSYSKVITHVVNVCCFNHLALLISFIIDFSWALVYVNPIPNCPQYSSATCVALRSIKFSPWSFLRVQEYDTILAHNQYRIHQNGTSLFPLRGSLK